MCVACGRRQGWPLSCRVCCPSPLLAVLGQSVRALGMGGDLRPTGLLIGKMHKDCNGFLCKTSNIVVSTN